VVVARQRGVVEPEDERPGDGLHFRGVWHGELRVVVEDLADVGGPRDRGERVRRRYRPVPPQGAEELAGGPLDAPADGVDGDFGGVPAVIDDAADRSLKCSGGAHVAITPRRRRRSQRAR
jgi:hypothetical protein